MFFPCCTQLFPTDMSKTAFYGPLVIFCLLGGQNSILCNSENKYSYRVAYDFFLLEGRKMDLFILQRTIKRIL